MKNEMHEPIVVIDSFPQNARRYTDDYAVVCVDVIRSTTTAITAVHLGRRCFPVPSLDRALQVANFLGDERPVMAGETREDAHKGFGISNSPSALAGRDDVDRPLILMSSSGTELIHEASRGLITFLACLRNYTAAADILAGRYRKVAVIGAGSHGEFREEDQLCCAWIAQILADRGFRPATPRTRDLIKKWKGARIEDLAKGKSAEFLLNSGQQEDLDFILSHVDDIDASFMLAEDEILMIPRVFYSPETAMKAFSRGEEKQ